MSYTTFRDQSNINKNHLDLRYINHFRSHTLIDKLSSSLCQGSFLSKKEYCESVEVVRVIQRFIRSDQQLHIYDICGGHGFVGILLSLFSKAIISANIIDQKRPLSFDRIVNCVEQISPDAVKQVHFIQEDYQLVNFKKNSLLIGIHACGIRTDWLMDLAFKNKCGIAILPCCYKKECLPEPMKKLSSVYELKELIDIHRITRALNNGYSINTKSISAKVTPMNRMFIFLPDGFYNTNVLD